VIYADFTCVSPRIYVGKTVHSALDRFGQHLCCAFAPPPSQVFPRSSTLHAFWRSLTGGYVRCPRVDSWG
jgi:hypothetical protein